MHDVGGQAGFGPVPIAVGDEPPFKADWEARVWAVNNALMRRGAYNVDEFRDAIERLAPADYLEASYYERWMRAIEMLLEEKGLA